MAVADFVAEAFETDALRAAIAWRGVRYCSLGPWSAGIDGDPARATRAGNDGGAAGQTVFADRRAGRRCRRRWRRRRGPPAPRSAAARRSRRSPPATAGSRASRWRSGEEIAAPAVVSGLDPKRTLVDLVRPGRRRAVDALAGRQLPDAGRRGQGQPRRSTGCRGSPPPAATTSTLLRGRIVVAPGIDAIERAFDAVEVRPGLRRRPSSRRRSRRSSTRRSSRARRPGRTS